MRDPCHIESDPECDEARLRKQKGGCPKAAGEGLGFDTEPVAAEDRGEVRMRGMEAQVVLAYDGRLGDARRWGCGSRHNRSFAGGAAGEWLLPSIED